MSKAQEAMLWLAGCRVTWKKKQTEAEDKDDPSEVELRSLELLFCALARSRFPHMNPENNVTQRDNGACTPAQLVCIYHKAKLYQIEPITVQNTPPQHIDVDESLTSCIKAISTKDFCN